jgi:hypothetical protein
MLVESRGAATDHVRHARHPLHRQGRRWAFIRDGQVRSGFPWLTIRERPELARYRPRFTEPGRPDASPTRVRTPSGGDLDVADPALAAELGPGVRVIKQNRGVFDTMPLSLLTTQTLAGLGRMVGTGLAGTGLAAGSCASAGCACGWTSATSGA